ncbi:SCO family protein [Corticimicrobacter populi]|uniref:SCO family protein n=1 Tax=Corticimicrobacter populi TaxID=2175229 RepID=A0A2V1K590_9BURK|nr:SCO family protein [Corticimicrobacter populi]PWF25403.1 SCO family protein [Corticimicrobacter populi]
MSLHSSRRLFLAAMGALTLAVAGCSQSDELTDINGIDLSTANLGKSFELTDTEGNTRTLKDFDGKAVMIFFGFTQCPDVCPTALYRATEVKQMLGDDADKLQVLFITVDPERDTPEILKSYVTAFDPGFIGLYGDLDRTAKTARDFKVYYEKVPTASSYTIDHTALSYLYDTKGRLRLALRHTQTADEYAADIRKVLAAN